MAQHDARIEETSDGHLQVELPELPRFDVPTDQELIGLEAAHEEWCAADPAGAEAFREWAARVTDAAGTELAERGFWGSKGAEEILEAWTSIRTAADPIYSWVPIRVRKQWLRNRRGRRILDLYCFQVLCTCAEEEILSLVQAAVLADSLCRGTYAALRWRLNHSGKGNAIGAATLRLLAGSDDVAASILQAAGLGPPEVFTNEFSREATAVLQRMVSAGARMRWGLFLDDSDEEDEATRNALNDAVAGSVSARSTDLLRLALGEVPGHIVAQAVSNFAHAVRAIVRQRATRADAFRGEDNPSEAVVDPTAQPDASATVRRDFEKFVSRLSDPAERKLIRIMIENPDARLEDLASAADMPVPTTHRQRTKLREKFKNFQAIDRDQSNSARPPRKTPT